MLVISHVHPFPGVSGQQQRVRNTLLALRQYFHVTFLTFAPQDAVGRIKQECSTVCDEALVLPARYPGNWITHLAYRTIGVGYQVVRGLKFSNFWIGNLEFSKRRLSGILGQRTFDLVLYEYWHASGSLPFFQQRGIPCVLDMHNILWQSYAQQLKNRTILPESWQRLAIRRYQVQEENVWRKYNGLIAINQAEYEYTSRCIPVQTRLFYAPMGIDLDAWPYNWNPAQPARLAYYGALGSRHNQRNAVVCLQQIMPVIWQRHPEVELWLVGSNPPDYLIHLSENEPRLHVTGFVPRVQEVLSTMTAVLCPWQGTYGFRSRLVEVMALGVPVIASPDAVHGMQLVENNGLILEKDSRKMADHFSNWYMDPGELARQSLAARRQIEDLYSNNQTYQLLAEELLHWRVEFVEISALE